MSRLSKAEAPVPDSPEIPGVSGHVHESGCSGSPPDRPGPCEGSEIEPPAASAEHDHHHGHAHPHGRARNGSAEERQRDRRRLLGTLGLTAGMMVFEAIGGYLSGSLALLSDAGHMLTDAAALLLAALALWFAGRPADLKRTYGFFRLEVLSALANGVTLVAIAALIG